MSEESNLLVNTGEGSGFSFSNLGVWRKIYLGINWALSIFIVVTFIAAGLDKDGGLFVSLTFTAFIMAYTFWLHYAITHRKVTQLTVLTIIQVIPLLNPVGALVMFAIRSTSIKEVNA